MAGISSVSFTGIYGTAYKKDSDGKEVKVPINLDSKDAFIKVKDEDQPYGQKKIHYGKASQQRNLKNLEEGKNTSYDRVEIDRIDEKSKAHLSTYDEIPIGAMADNAQLTERKAALSEISQIEGENVSINLFDSTKAFINGKAAVNLYTDGTNSLSNRYVKVSGEDMKLSASA